MIDMPAAKTGAGKPDTHARRFAKAHYHESKRYTLKAVSYTHLKKPFGGCGKSTGGRLHLREERFEAKG